MSRVFQVARFGWHHAKDVPGPRLAVLADILYCYARWGMWSNQYAAERMWGLDRERRREVGEGLREANRARDEWQRDFRANKRFLHKYMDTRWEFPRLRGARNRAYAERYNMGPGAMVEHGVEISRQHYLPGEVRMGERVLLAKNCFLDYSGFLEIGDDVQITDGVHILTHDHLPHHGMGTARDYPGNDVQGRLVIGDGAVIGTRAVVLPSCHYIGRQARVGAGAVVSRDVPDFAVALGVPARVVRVNGEAGE